MRMIKRPSPNFGERRGGVSPSLVVLHHTAMLTAENALERLCDPDAEVSAHYLIAEDGRLWRLVAEEDRAWHAGAGAWRQFRDLNSHSIGIELANPAGLAGFPPFPEPQMVALEALLDEVTARWNIERSGIIAHSDLAPERKSDPGPKFDWRRLAVGGRGIWPDNNCPAAPAGDFSSAASLLGYRVSEASAASQLSAFRLRFRPWDVTGQPNQRDLLAVAQLASEESSG